MIRKIEFNWFSTTENGEAFSVREVGKEYDYGKVLKIKEHQTHVECDKWFYDVCYTNGITERIFNANYVVIEEDK